MATEDTIQNLIRLTRLHFRALRKSYAKTTFYMNRKELLALGISTVKELKLFDEGSWVAHVSRVKWNQQEAGKAGVIYRTDLFRMAKAGDLEHIPGKAEIDKVYFKTACPLPILSIRERLQELRLDIESDISADILVMCKWPGKDVINSINLNAQDPDVLMRINRIEEKHLSCFRMLKRMIKPKPPEQQPESDGEQQDSINHKSYIKKGTSAWEFGFNGGTAQVGFKPNKELKGLALIEFLLIHPDREYTPLKLLQETGQREKWETEPEKKYTEADIKKLKDDIESLDGFAKSTTDLEKKEELEQKVKDAKAILYKARNCMGKSRKISEGNRLSVIRNIGTVLNKIAPQHKELFNHLDTFLNKGEICCYKHKDFIWEIN